MAFPPPGSTSLQQTIPSYLYQEYDDDADLQAYVQAINALGQGYLESMLSLDLAIYTSTSITGVMLDWIGQGIYGIPRPGAIPLSLPSYAGAINTFTINTLVIDGFELVSSGTQFFCTDDVYKRILTWHFYKGDGFQISIPWLKRRCARFFHGVNGVDPGVSTTYDVGISISSGAAGVITWVGSDPVLGPVFQACVEGGILALPFQIDWSVTLA